METAFYSQKFLIILGTEVKISSQKNIIAGNLVGKLRYGENPHQHAAIYSQNDYSDIQLLNGKPLSYNNYNDLYSALEITKSFPKNKGTAIIKHANPCGVSINKKTKCFKEALDCDPLSAWGDCIL